ncbi:MAG: hypothetical protein AAB380_03660 [Verrucomicrobiota bacterium]
MFLINTQLYWVLKCDEGLNCFSSFCGAEKPLKRLGHVGPPFHPAEAGC